MRSELFEETIKQHKDSLTDELVQLGKHRQAQLAEWDIEQNETDYEFYFDSAWNYQQSKVDELQRRNQMLNDNIKEQGQKLVYQNEVIETQAEKLLGLRDEKSELQKRVDEQTRHIEMALLAVKDIHKSAIDEFHDWDVLNEKAPKLCEHLQNLSVAVGELEQALKGGGK